MSSTNPSPSPAALSPWIVRNAKGQVANGGPYASEAEARAACVYDDDRVELCAAPSESVGPTEAEERCEGCRKVLGRGWKYDSAGEVKLCPRCYNALSDGPSEAALLEEKPGAERELHWPELSEFKPPLPEQMCDLIEIEQWSSVDVLTAKMCLGAAAENLDRQSAELRRTHRIERALEALCDQDDDAAEQILCRTNPYEIEPARRHHLQMINSVRAILSEEVIRSKTDA